MTPDALDRAPDFPDDRRWFHVDRPPSLHRELAGNVVLVFFLTTSCVHCLQVLPTLRFLEQRFLSMPFSVVFVLSPKYQAERDPRHVAGFLRLHGVRCPVVLDDDRSLWKLYSCQAWPTLVLIDARGTLRYRGAGEPDRERLASAVESLLEEASSSGSLGVPLFRPDLPPIDRTRLSQPTNLAFDPIRKWLWIADTGNHRVLAVAVDTGEVQRVVGGMAAGAGDASIAEASFAGPRGIALFGPRVFVADTGNHLIRSISMLDEEVSTVVGQGRPVRDREGGQFGIDQGLCSPMGLTMVDGRLHVAMAGANQLWSVDIDTAKATAEAGSGRETELDGPGETACFAKPAAMAATEGWIAVADAQGNTIRLVERGTGQVTTLAGGGLFSFGWRDGAGREARFQHPMDIVWHEGSLLVADTYNDAIRHVTRPGVVTTPVPPGRGLHRPEGLCMVGDRLFVCDTGNDRLVVVDLSTGEVQPFPLQFPPKHEATRLPAIHLRSRSSVRLRFMPPVPIGTRLHPDAPAEVRLTNLAGRVLTADLTMQALSFSEDFLVEDVPTADQGSGVLGVTVHFLTCNDVDAVCHLQRFDAEVEVEVGPEGLYEVWLRSPM